MNYRLPCAVLLVFTGLACGAPPPSPGEAAKTHWAFQPVREVEPPKVQHEAWVRTPVDRFILAKLEEKQLASGTGGDTGATHPPRDV